MSWNFEENRNSPQVELGDYSHIESMSFEELFQRCQEMAVINNMHRTIFDFYSHSQKIQNWPITPPDSRATLMQDEFDSDTLEDQSSLLVNPYPSPSSSLSTISQNNNVEKKGRLVFDPSEIQECVKCNRQNSNARVVSNKIFVGGIGPHMEREDIIEFFSKFGNVFIDWPTKQSNGQRGTAKTGYNYSYLFLVYSEEDSVIRLMNSSDNRKNEYFVHIPGYLDTIQIRPWFLMNAFYVKPGAMYEEVVDVHRTVFVGGLPRIVTAEEVANLLSTFGNVLLVTIDIDQDYGYPKGAARVTFEEESSFNNALDRKFLRFEGIDTNKTTIEIKPYVMEDVGCDQCGGLWFNPYNDVMDHLNASLKQCHRLEMIDDRMMYDIWSCGGMFSSNRVKLVEKERAFNAMNSRDEEIYESSDESASGAIRFLKVAKKFNLQDRKKYTINGVAIPIGPTLWNMFLPTPKVEVCNDMMINAQIGSHLKLKRDGVYSNKSVYCREKPCRQYYCSSCSHKLHTSHSQLKYHSQNTSRYAERRLGRDKSMYLGKKVSGGFM